MRMSSGNPLNVALVVSHPIQHFCPQYASFARHPGIRFKVFFASALGHKAYHDPNFNTTIAWDNLRLESFDHQFLNGGEVLQPGKELDAPGIEDALAQFDPQVVIIYGYYQKLQRRVYRWARRQGVTIAYIADTEMRQQRNRLKELIKYPYLRNFFSGIGYALTVGDANEAYYKYVGLKKDQLVRMHFPIDIDLYRESYANRRHLRDAVRQQHNIPADAFVASVAGKLVPWKNQADIIKAMKLLEGQGLYMHLFMLGSGEMMDAWKQEAQELRQSRVHFTGFVSPGVLPAFYAASDVYIHPAAAEPHSLAISEAIYMGCPAIISHRCGSHGPTDDVQEGKSGFVYPCGDITALAGHIKRLAQQPAERMALGQYAHTIAEAFQQQAHGGVIDSLISKVRQHVAA